MRNKSSNRNIKIFPFHSLIRNYVSLELVLSDAADDDCSMDGAYLKFFLIVFFLVQCGDWLKINFVIFNNSSILSCVTHLAFRMECHSTTFLKKIFFDYICEWRLKMFFRSHCKIRKWKIIFLWTAKMTNKNYCEIIRDWTFHLTSLRRACRNIQQEIQFQKRPKKESDLHGRLITNLNNSVVIIEKKKKRKNSVVFYVHRICHHQCPGCWRISTTTLCAHFKWTTLLLASLRLKGTLSQFINH